VLDKAAKEAIRLRHNWLGPEHYLLAVLAESGNATDTMAELGLTHDGIAIQLAQLKTVSGKRTKYVESKGITSNPSAHDVSGWATGFAAGAGRQTPTREDWLLAVMYAGGGIVAAVLHPLGITAAGVVEVIRRRGIRTPPFLPEEDRPWRGRNEVEVEKSEWQMVVDVLSDRIPPSSTLRWGFNSSRNRPGKIQFVAEDGIDLDAVVLEARSRLVERE
jgi:ATP-dependent Clp protease ATP-binding subunit ClpA